MKADLASTRSAVIVIPRMEVSNVTYAPLFSPQGRPIGLRIAYDAKFSNRPVCSTRRWESKGSPSNERWRSQTRMEDMDSTITPRPREAFPAIRSGDLERHQNQSPHNSGATYRYEAGTVYHFTADLVPDSSFTISTETRRASITRSTVFSVVAKAIRGDFDLRGPHDILGARGRPHGPCGELLQ